MQPKINHEAEPIAIHKEDDVEIILKGRGREDTKLVKVDITRKCTVSPQREVIMTRNRLNKNLLKNDEISEEASNNENSLKAT
jgi:hypothetical protein